MDDVDAFIVPKYDVEKRISSEFIQQLETLKLSNIRDLLIVGLSNKPWKLDTDFLQWYFIISLLQFLGYYMYMYGTDLFYFGRKSLKFR